MASAKALDALALVGVRLLASLTVWLLGFRAVSDDDFARVVIAQRFAEAPALDPSGTSWLPFPFWLQGGAMLLFGTNLETARAVALASGVASTLLIWVAAHWLGLGRAGALIAAAAASLFPYAAWLGIATVPEQLTAALLVLGAASTASHSESRRSLGALAVCVATLSRYESWPVALALALMGSFDAFRHKRPTLHLSSALALSGMLGWVLHGAVNHGSASFFVERVARYQHALDGEQQAWLAGLLRYPLLAARHEPELVALAALGALSAWRLGQGRALLPLVRPLLLMAALLLFLIVSDLRRAGATHHPERALLPLWSCLGLVVGASFPALTRELKARVGLLPIALGTAGLAVLMSCLAAWRSALGERAPFINRSAELELGERARAVAGEGRLLIVAKDYGYFAVMAGFGAPERAAPLDDRDPRHARAQAPFDDLALFRHRLRREGVRALVVPETERESARKLGVVEGSAGDYLLVRVLDSRTE